MAIEGVAMEIGGFGTPERWERLAAAYNGPRDRFPWEVVLLDESVDTFAPGETVALVALYYDSDSDACVLSYRKVDEKYNVTQQELHRRIAAVVPSVAMLVHMQARREKLDAATREVFDTDDDRARVNGLLSLANAQFAGTGLPVALCMLQVDDAGNEHLVFLGPKNLPLNAAWFLFSWSVAYAAEG